MTPIDQAHEAMMARPDEDWARMAFYDRVSGAELFLLLTREPDGDALDPRVFETSQGTFVLAFDRLERLTDFAGAAPYAALPGRTLVAMLSGEGTGVALNPEVAPSSFLIPPDAIAWLAETIAGRPDEMEARISALSAPKGLPERLLTALDGKLASATGLARMAYLAGATYDGGGADHVLAVIDATPGAEGAIAMAVREALIFSGLEAGALDVAFFAGGDPVAERLSRVGLRFDVPAFEPAGSAEPPAAPGSDPDRPPRLR